MSLPEYDAFIVGKEAGPVEIEVDSHRVRSFVYAVDDFDPLYLSGSDAGGPFMPVPLLTSDDPEFAKLQTTTINAALAARYDVRSYEPIKIGQRVLLQSRNEKKYIRRGKGYIVRAFDVLDAGDRRPLTRSHLVEMIGLHAGRETERSVPAKEDKIEPRPAGRPPVVRARRDIPAETPLPQLTKTVTRKQMFVFSARPGWWTSIHTDPDFARSLGLPDAIAQGLMSAGYVSQMCTSFFRESWFTSGEMSLAFIKPVCVDDVLTIEGRVIGYDVEDGQTRLHLDVWCQKHDSQITTVGRAYAAVD